MLSGVIKLIQVFNFFTSGQLIALLRVRKLKVIAESNKTHVLKYNIKNEIKNIILNFVRVRILFEFLFEFLFEISF